MIPLKKIALIVAAGKSTRLGGEVPKPYVNLGEKSVLQRSIEAFLRHDGIDAVQVVINPDHEHYYNEATKDLDLLPVVHGGVERHNSVLTGLSALKGTCDVVLIHDAARPFIDNATIDRVLEGLEKSEAVIPVIPVVDTIKTVAGDTLDRKTLTAVQTPQGFHFNAILAAHEKNTLAVTDDAQLMPQVKTVPGHEKAFKITTMNDLNRAKQLLGSSIRTGQGYDVHRLKAGDGVVLGGVKIACNWALEGHSDADVALHALTDALLGTIGAGDIGQHFPPSDEKWKNTDSKVFVKKAMQLLKAKGGDVLNADITLICEEPKIGPHREAMQKEIAALLGTQNINVKATTTEGLGFTGRKEGIAAQAVVTVAICHED